MWRNELGRQMQAEREVSRGVALWWISGIEMELWAVDMEAGINSKSSGHCGQTVSECSDQPENLRLQNNWEDTWTKDTTHNTQTPRSNTNNTTTNSYKQIRVPAASRHSIGPTRVHLSTLVLSLQLMTPRPQTHTRNKQALVTHPTCRPFY